MLCVFRFGKKVLQIKLINIYYVRKENIWHSAVNVIQISVTGKTQSAVWDIFSSLTLVCIYEACCQIKLSTLNTFIDATVKYSTTYHWATFHINPGKLFWQEVTDHYISKLFSHFYSTLFFSALSPHPIHLKMTVGIASILKSWKTGQSQCHTRPLFFSGQKCLTNLNLITMSWIRLWESIRHFLPKTTMRIHTQAKKKKTREGEWE